MTSNLKIASLIVIIILISKQLESKLVNDFTLTDRSWSSKGKNRIISP